MKYPKTVAACRRVENSQWEIADALLEEVGPPDGNGSIAEVVEELEDAGLDIMRFSLTYLQQLRLIAFRFPPRKRRAKLSFSVYKEAQTPEMLEKIISLVDRDQKVTERLVRRIMVRQREKAEQKFDAEMERNRAQHEAASKRLHEAEEKKRRARSQADREAAMREVKAAREQRRNIPQPPPRPLPVTDAEIEPPTKIDVMIADLEIMTKTSQALRLGEEVLEAVTKRIEDFDISDVKINAFVEEALSASNMWRRVADAVRKYKTNKRGHLIAVR